MATEFELLTQRVERLENVLSKVLPLVPQGIADINDTAEFEKEKERLRKEAPEGKVVIEATAPTRRTIT